MRKDLANFPGMLLHVRWFIIYNILGDAKVTMIYIFESKSQKKKSMLGENKRFTHVPREMVRKHLICYFYLFFQNSYYYRCTFSVQNVFCGVFKHSNDF